MTKSKTIKPHKKKKRFNVKITILVIASLVILIAAAAAIAQSVLNDNQGDPFLLVFTNGKNEEANSDYRLFGRHRLGYPGDKDLDNKMGAITSFGAWESEFGLVLDNSNPAVQAEQLNWLYYLLFYKQLFKGQEDFLAKNNDYKYNVDKSTFDGIRIDCGDGIDSDVTYQTGNLMDKLYDRQLNDAVANDHLDFAEGYGPKDIPVNEKYFKNSGLNYDDSYYENMTPTIRYYDDNDVPNLKNGKSLIATNWENDQTEDNENNPIVPNLTYSQNHDNFYMKLVDIAKAIHPDFDFTHFTQKTLDDIKDASEAYYNKMKKTDKNINGVQASPKNQVSLYADMLTNKDTVPIVFYGDIFESDKDYMSKPSPIAEPIMDILGARSNYVAGGQQRKVVDNGKIITNVRFGKGYYEGKTNQNSEDFKNSRNSGIVTVYSNDKNVNDKNLKVYVGKNHAGQWYSNLIDTDSSNTNDDLGLTLGEAADKNVTVMGVKPSDQLAANNTQKLKVDNDGNLTIAVQGTNKPFVDGYLSMWVPNGETSKVAVTEDQAAKMNSYKKTNKILNSNSALDSHVMYQDFAVNLPDQGHVANDRNPNPNPKEGAPDAYEMLAKKADDIAASGITDIWMAPPYTSPTEKEGPLRDDVERYGYGYVMEDRYNLGTNGKYSKYGSAGELITATDKLHKAVTKLSDEGKDNRTLKLLVDFVPHQIARGDSDQQEDVTFNEYSSKKMGSWLHLIAAQVTAKLRTRTSNDNCQYKYGGKYLATIKQLFPELFKMPALSTGKTLPDNELIKNWSAKYEDSYSMEFDHLWKRNK